MAGKGEIPQDSGEYEVGYGKPPQTEASKKTRYGGEKENPRGQGFYKVEDTARAKFEVWIKLTEDELDKLLEKKNLASFDETTINLILQLQRLVRILKDMVDELEKEKDIEKKVRLTTYCVSQLEKIMSMLERISNQIYGTPIQRTEQTTIELKPILPPIEGEEAD